jgi:hypothetical protein
LKAKYGKNVGSIIWTIVMCEHMVDLDYSELEHLVIYHDVEADSYLASKREYNKQKKIYDVLGDINAAKKCVGVAVFCDNQRAMHRKKARIYRKLLKEWCF